MKSLTALLTAFVIIASLSNASAAGSQTLWQRIQAEPSLSTFASLVEAAGFEEMLSSAGSYTVFAPSEATLDDLSADVRAAVVEAPGSEAARRFIARHIAQGRLLAQGVMGRELSTEMLSGENLRFAARFAGCGTLDASLDQAELLFTDIAASNGVLHILAEPL